MPATGSSSTQRRGVRSGVSPPSTYEAAVRRIQTIEWVHHEKVRDSDLVAGDKITVEEMAAFSGTTRTSDVLMVSPALLSHVKSVVSTDVTIMTSVRKAREERELRRKNHGGKKKGNKGGDGAAGGE